MTLSERLKSLKTSSYPKMSEQSGVSEYKISRIMNGKPTSDELQSLINICEHCFEMHIIEVLQPVMTMALANGWEKTEEANGVKETVMVFRVKV